MNAKPFPWDEAMAFGFGILRLSPDVFWRMTPRELAAALRAVHGQTLLPFGRESFDDLLTRFPDGPRSHKR